MRVNILLNYIIGAKKVRKARKMTKKNRKIRVLTAVIAAVMLISTVLTVYLSADGTTYYGSSPSISNLTGSVDLKTENLYNESVIYKLPDTVKESDDLSIIVQTKTETLLDAYDKSGSSLSFSEYILTDEARKIKNDIYSNSEAVREKLDGISYTLGERYNTLISGFEIVIKAADFEDVCRAVKSDANVYIGEVYNVSETKLVENKVNVYGTGIFSSEEFVEKYGVDATGIVVAVLDTGIDYYHSAFSDSTFTADRNKLGLDFEDIKSIMAGNDMAAESMVPGLTAEDVYIGNKIPYAFDYADSDSDVFPLLSNHGTHVSGVIAGNRLEHIEAEDYTGEFVGVAPNAQIAAMKIFSDVESTSHTSWILAALEDCVALGVDVINMSIGTTCGFSRETDREFESGVYDKIRERGISLVVAASNSFNSTYGSDKNGNLPLTSNPDSATVGSPSTYKGALSVASIEGAKTPYLLYNETIMYFIESTNRVSKEKHFVDELLGDGVDEKEFEYVLIAGAGSSAADYSGIDVKGKIALIKRGYNTFEEKAALAEEMGAAGVIIYNNVSGDIKMNVGETGIAVCSISQNDGEMLAAARSGKIKISRSQTSGPFMSDFSSWGPTPDLEIKPEITAHGGSILSAVPGEDYDRISGTSMATPNISGVSALLRQYVIEKFGFDGDTDAAEITATVNRLMMSTADIVTNKNGLPYSVRKQGAGLANLLDSAATNAYIVTYGDDNSIMDKSKIELGDDPDKTGVYELKFGVYNFGSGSITYGVDYHVFTEGVSETKTNQGETTVTETAFALEGVKVEIVSVSGGSKNGESITVPAGATADVTVRITLTDENKKYLDESFENGMYVEGYVMLKAEGGEEDLNVPYLAFYGDWTKSPLFDLDYFETNRDELDDSIDPLDKTLPDAYATRPIGGSTGDYVSYLGSYYFEQNPQNKIIAADRKYIALSNQNANGEINSLRFIWAGMLRGAARVEIVITEDSTGEIVYENIETYIRKSYGDGGPIRPANIDVEFSAIDQNLKNNTAYTVTVKGYLDYERDGADTNLSNEFVFPLVTDFSAPALTDCEFYTEYDRSTKKTRLFAKLAIYDNHYSMALQAGYVGTDSTGAATFNSFDKYATPIYSDFNSTSYVTYELTDYIDSIASGAMNTNCFTIACYDYAMNSATYEIALPDDFKAFYFEEEEIILSPNEVYDLSPIVYPSTEWGELITLKSNNTRVVSVINGKLVAVGSGGAMITATAPDGSKATVGVTVLRPGDKGYQEYTKPVAESFTLTGFYVNKAFYKLDNTDRDIGTTGDELKFASHSYYALSLYPSESVTLRYDLQAYFPNATSVVFESGNESIVTINKTTGQLIAVDEGLASVTAKVMMDDKDTLYSATVNIEVKEPYITSGPSLTNYFGAGDSANHVTFPADLAITEIGQFAFSNYDYVDKGPDDEISDEAPETMKMWFIGDNTIKQVTLPEGVERIGPYAFANMTALEKITLPSTLETIDYGAFYGCTALKEIKGIENVKFINQSAFQGCAITGTLNLDNAVAIANYAFASNAAITKVNLPETLQSLGAYAFGANTRLKSVEIKAEKIKLGQYAFTDCTSLESISINASVIPAGAFNMCRSLRSVTLGKDVSVIGEYAFRNTAVSSFKVADGNTTFISCEGGEYLTNTAGTEILLVAPTKLSFSLNDPKITSVGNAAFSGSNNLVTVSLPYVTYLGDYAFSECENLRNIELGKLTNIGSYAFENTDLKSFELESGITIGDHAFSRSKVESVIVGDGLTVPEACFYNCTKLKSVVIGDNVTVGAYAFYNDHSHADNYEVVRNVYNSATGKGEPKTYAIYYVVFDGPITSLTIGDNAVLETGAFYGAANLTEAALGVNAVIGDYAFYNCSSLEKVINLNKAIYIGESAFSGDIHFEYTSADYTSVDITDKGEYTYRYYAPAFTSVDISSASVLGKNAFAACKKLETVIIGEELTVIPDSAFQACDLLSSINLDKVTSIGGYAFAECALLNINISNAKFIGEYAFCYNEELVSAILGAEDAVIEEGAFSYCKSLFNIEGEENASYIGDYSFAYSALSYVDLSSAEYIGTHAFFKEEVTEFAVKLGKSLTNIGDNPFANCTIAPFFTTKDEVFADQVMNTKTVYTFDLSDSVKIIDGSIYRVVPKGLELIAWMGGTTAKVADGTVRISAMAFAGDDVKMVVLPSTVAAIGHKAFYGCKDLIFVSFASYSAPILEEEYDNLYYESMENIPAAGNYDFVDNYGFPLYYDGIEITPFFMWNVTALPSNFFYGANFVDYVGHVDNKITMIRPSNGKNYDSFIMNQYFTLTVDGALAADDITLAAIAAIGQIPQNVKDIKLQHKDIIQAARAAYDLITSFEQRSLVPGDTLAILASAEQRIADLEHLMNDGSGDENTIIDNEVNIYVVILIIVGAIFSLVVIAFIVVLILFIRILKKGGLSLLTPEKKEEKNKGESSPEEEYEYVAPIIHKAAPVKKLEKKSAEKLADVDDLLARQESKTDKYRRIIVILASIAAALILIAGIVWAIASGDESFYAGYEEDGYTVSITFDSNGGSFKGSDSSVIDLYNPENVSEDGIKLLAPDDERRDKSNALTVTKAGHFLAGWYRERTLIDENAPEKGYTYSGKWDFENDRVYIDPSKEYSAEESVMTLYAAWVPYYKYEIYTKDEGGNEILVSTASAINLTIPEWADGGVVLEMDNFPKRNGYTLDSVYYDAAMTDKVVGETVGSGKNKVISGEWDEATATSLTPTIKLYTTWQEGERYRIYSAEDLRKNADSAGYYEIYADLDFTGIEWPSIFVNGKFSGKIFGNYHTITGISVESTSRSRINNGIFASLDENAYIEHLNFENVTHTIDLMSVATDASFGLLTGMISKGAKFNDVTVSGKIVIGDNCAELASGNESYVIGKVAGIGDTDGIIADVSVEKANPDNGSFDIEISDGGTISIIPGSN